MKFINDSDKRIINPDPAKPDQKPEPMTVDIARPGLGRIYCEAGKVVDIPDDFARPRRAVNGARIPSVIECLAPQLRPADKSELANWEKAPPAIERKAGDKRVTASSRIPTLEELTAQGMAPGAARAKIAKMMAEKSLAEQEAEDAGA